MPALVESMFYVRQTPWHGLGTRVEDAPTSKDAIRLAGLDWTVDPKPIFDADGDEIPGYVANVRSSDNSILGIVSDRYSIVQNFEAFEFTDALVADGLTYETAGSLRNGKCIWLLGKLPETSVLDDKVEPYICFTNAHDGTGSVRVCLTPIRVVCNNTLNLALNTAKRSWSTKHVGDTTGKLAEAQETLGLASKYMTALESEADRLTKIKVSDEEVEAMLDAIYLVKDTDSDMRKAKIRRLKDNFFTCIEADDIKKYRGTAYGVINAVTDFVGHAEPLRKTSNFEENRWGQIIVGHPFVDQMYKKLA